MSSSKSVSPPSLTGSPLQNGSPTKGFGPGFPPHKDTPTGLLSESQQPGTSGNRDVAPFASPSKEKGKEKLNQHRLSQVVPRLEKKDELKGETEPWKAKNILSFDGGGIRGLYSLLILEHLMEEILIEEGQYVDGTGGTAKATSSFHPNSVPKHVSHLPQDNDKHYLPCHYFDYICGTSTGGLIAIMLGRLRMTVRDCISEYEHLAGGVFGFPRTFHQTWAPTFWIKRPKYDAGRLENIIKEVIHRRGEVPGDGPERKFVTGEGICRAFVLAYKKTGQGDQRRSDAEFQTPYMFRSYPHHPRTDDPNLRVRNPGPASEYPLWKIARATTAAPLYFAPMFDEGPDRGGFSTKPLKKIFTGFAEPKQAVVTPGLDVFIDGGFGPTNNPSKEAINEVRLSNEEIGTLVSIGTGRGSIDKFQSGLLSFIRNGMASIGDPEPVHEQMKRDSTRYGYGFGYFRFNERNGLPDLDFDEWKPRGSGDKTRRTIQDAFHRWLKDSEAKMDIRRCARELVRRRRLRTADESQWERYAIKSHFDCKEHSCPATSDKQWIFRDDFKDHLKTDHGCTGNVIELETIINSHRTTWEYKPNGLANGVAH